MNLIMNLLKKVALCQTENFKADAPRGIGHFTNNKKSSGKTQLKTECCGRKNGDLAKLQHSVPGWRMIERHADCGWSSVVGGSASWPAACG